MKAQSIPLILSSIALALPLASCTEMHRNAAREMMWGQSVMRDYAGTGAAAPSGYNLEVTPPLRRGEVIRTEIARAELRGTNAPDLGGSVRMVKQKNGARLIVDLTNAAPGIYSVRILEGTQCTPTSNLREEVVAQMNVGEDRRAHAEVDLSDGQLQGRSLSDLQRHAVVVRDESTLDNEAERPVACGPLTIQSAG